MKKRYPFFFKNWLRCGLLTAFVCSLALSLQAQNGPAVQWDKTIGGSIRDELYSMQQTSDGGYILGGTSSSGISGDKSQACQGFSDYWVVKLDANGFKMWDKTFGGDTTDMFVSLQQTADGGYILGGYSLSGISGDKSQASRGDRDYWVVKLDASGNKMWDKTLGGSQWDEFYSLQQTSDGGYILGGGSGSPISGDKSQAPQHNWFWDYWIVKLDANGNKLWDKTIGGNNGNDILHTVQQTPDGGYILGGESQSGIGGHKSQASRGAFDYWVVKLDASGNKLWDKAFGGSTPDQLQTLQQTSDGGYILGGYSSSPISGEKSQACQGNSDYWVVKIDAIGNKMWDKTFGGNNIDWLYSVQQTSDGGYILGGTSQSPISGHKSQASQGNFDYWLVKLDASGNKMWDKTIGGNGTDWLFSLQQTSDGGYFMGGMSNSGISGDKSKPSLAIDFWVVKLGPNCADLTATITPACGNGTTGLNVNIDGLLPATSSTPAWTLTYTENGVSKTATGSTPTSAIVQNATPGTVYTLVSITSGSCTTNLANSLTMPAPISQPTINQISPDTLISSGTGTSYEWKLGGTVLPATTRKLKATANGVYAVRVKDYNCSSAFSQDYNFTVSGVKDAIETGIELYPNPTTGITTLKLIKPQFAQVKIYNP